MVTLYLCETERESVERKSLGESYTPVEPCFRSQSASERLAEEHKLAFENSLLLIDNVQYMIRSRTQWWHLTPASCGPHPYARRLELGRLSEMFVLLVAGSSQSHGEADSASFPSRRRMTCAWYEQLVVPDRDTLFFGHSCGNDSKSQSSCLACFNGGKGGSIGLFRLSLPISLRRRRFRKRSWTPR
jgi:hypothetical protein